MTVVTVGQSLREITRLDKTEMRKKAEMGQQVVTKHKNERQKWTRIWVHLSILNLEKKHSCQLIRKWSSLLIPLTAVCCQEATAGVFHTLDRIHMLII